MMKPSPRSSEPQPREGLEEAILAALKGIRFGSVEITVHDARVVQIERKERFRPGDEGGAPIGNVAS
ncbi:MAG: YezD family protein [Deinococcota bacterium]|nr:YezD family protein [Deinococcota bacterium]